MTVDRCCTEWGSLAHKFISFLAFLREFSHSGLSKDPCVIELRSLQASHMQKNYKILRLVRFTTSKRKTSCCEFLKLNNRQKNPMQSTMLVFSHLLFSMKTCDGFDPKLSQCFLALGQCLFFRMKQIPFGQTLHVFQLVP